jgi:hypothetical protein
LAASSKDARNTEMSKWAADRRPSRRSR